MKTRLLTGLVALVVALGFALPGFAPATAQGTFYREETFSNAQVLTATAASTSTATELSDATLAAFQLSCTEDSGTATLDAVVQRSIDGGSTWATIVTFTQLTATGSQTLLYADLRAASAQMIGDRNRVNYTIGGTGQYTCTTKAAYEA